MRDTVRYEDEGWQLVIGTPMTYIRHDCPKAEQYSSSTDSFRPESILRFGNILDASCPHCNKPAPEGIRGLYTMLIWGTEEGCNF